MRVIYSAGFQREYLEKIQASISHGSPEAAGNIEVTDALAFIFNPNGFCSLVAAAWNKSTASLFSNISCDGCGGIPMAPNAEPLWYGKPFKIIQWFPCLISGDEGFLFSPILYILPNVYLLVGIKIFKNPFPESFISTNEVYTLNP